MLYSRFLLLDQTLLFHWFHFWPSKRGRFWHPCRRLCSNRTQIRFASQRRSFTQTVRTVICKWSNQICVSRHRQPVRMGCCGNDIIDCVHRWGGFPTCKHEKWRSIIAPAKRSQCRNPNSRIDPAQLPRCTSVTLDRKSLLLCPGAGDSKNPVRSAVRVRTETQPTKSDWNLFSNHLQMYLRCANVAFHVRFFFFFFFFLLSQHSQWKSVNNCTVGSIDQSKMRVWGRWNFASSQFCSHLYSGKYYCGEKSFTFTIHIQVWHQVWRASLKSTFWGVKKNPNVHSRLKYRGRDVFFAN